MRFLCLSDIHGTLPELAPHLGGSAGSPGPADAVLIAGDITPHPAKDYARQRRWLDGPFRRWLEGIGRPVIGIAGNHDWVFAAAPQEVPIRLPWWYLQDAEMTLGGLVLYGTPHQPEFCSWAFNADEPTLCQHWAAISQDTDVLLVHGPPHEACDFVPSTPWNRGGHVGSPGLRARIEVVKPKLVVCGHIHGSYGTDWIGDTLVINASLLGEDYRMCNRPVLVDVPAGAGLAEVIG